VTRYVRLSNERYEALLSGHFSGLSGYRDLAAAALVHWDHDPTEHPDVVAELETALTDVVLETAEAVMRDHGLSSPTDHK
jgi:hypothetical protein